MKVEVQEITEITRRLEITVPAASVNEEFRKVYQEIAKTAKLKGFRPGKVPSDVLRKYYRQDAESEAVKHLINHSYPEALREVNLHPVSYPDISVQNLKEGEDLRYQAVIEIRPTLEIQGYEGLKLVRNKTIAKDEEIAEGLKSLQERAAQIVPLAKARKTEKGDVVIFDYNATMEGKPVPNGEVKDYMAELGKGALLPEFEKELIGLSADEKKEIAVSYKTDWPDSAVAGRKVTYEVVLKDIKEKKLPELNDEFAKDLGEFKTLEEVKLKIRDQITQEKERGERNGLVQQIIKKLAEKNRCPVPNGMIQMELEAMYQHLADTIRSRGLNEKQVGLEWEDFSQKNREEAKNRVMGALFFDAIAKKENLQVTDEEVQKKIEELAGKSGQPVEKLRKEYQEKNLLPALQNALLEEKTLDFVLSHAKIEAKE